MADVLAHTAGIWQLTAAAAGGIGAIAHLHGQQDVEIGEIHSGVVPVFALSAGARWVRERANPWVGLEGRWLVFFGATKEGDTFAVNQPPSTTTIGTLSVSVILGWAL